jgi:hypothetical protein
MTLYSWLKGAAELTQKGIGGMALRYHTLHKHSFSSR